MLSSRRGLRKGRQPLRKSRWVFLRYVVYVFFVVLLWVALQLGGEMRESQDLADTRSAEELGSFAPVDVRRTSPVGNHKLRYNWNNMVSASSDLAKRIHDHQNNCSLPLANFAYRNRFGLGSDIHMWAQAICNAMEKDVRVRTVVPWIWLDESACDLKEANRSAMFCYFPLSELPCEEDVVAAETEEITNWLGDPRGRIRSSCDRILEKYRMSDVRAAATEYLFRSVSPVVTKEAERQLNLVFPNGVPENLITVHVRWGDKRYEVKLLEIDDYIKGVQQILNSRVDSTTASIYLATEDPKAVKAFKEKAPASWKVYVDQYYFDMLEFRNETDEWLQGPKTSKQTNGRAGLVALGSLLVALEADDYVLTTISNWSLLMNELRKNVLDLICDNCTNVIDLKPEK